MIRKDGREKQKIAQRNRDSDCQAKQNGATFVRHFSCIIMRHYANGRCFNNIEKNTSNTLEFHKQEQIFCKNEIEKESFELFIS